jgi:hypothetical protein
LESPLVFQSKCSFSTVEIAGAIAGAAAAITGCAVFAGAASPSQAAPDQAEPAPQPERQAPATQTASSVKVGNMAALYSDKLTDADNEH